MLQVDRIVNSIFDSITWLLSETESNRVWLVDCGDIAPVLEKVKEKTVEGVLLTHAHFDHIYGLPELVKHYPECVVYTNSSGREALGNAKQNMSYYYESPVSLADNYVKLCEEGDEIILYNDCTAKVLSTPGHHSSCLTYVIDRYLFTGDAFMPGVKVITNLPGGNKLLANESEIRIKTLLSRYHLCMGHFFNVE